VNCCVRTTRSLRRRSRSSTKRSRCGFRCHWRIRCCCCCTTTYRTWWSLRAREQPSETSSSCALRCRSHGFSSTRRAPQTVKYTSTQNDRAPPKKMRGPDCRRTGHDVRPSRLFENETALFVGRFHGRLLLSRVCGQFRPRLTWNLCINLQSRSVSVHQLRNVLSADLHVDNATVTRVCIYKYSYTRPSVSGHCKSGCIFRRTLTFDLLL